MAKPKLITDVKPWSTMELFDLRLAIEQGQTIEMTAALLGREVKDAVRKAEELNLIQANEQQQSAESGFARAANSRSSTLPEVKIN